MKTWKKRGLIGAGIAVVIIIAIMSLSKAVDVEEVKVIKGDVSAVVVEKGKITSEESVDIYSEIQGKVKDLYVEEGDTVVKGDRLAEIDAGDIEAQIAALEGQLKSIEGLEKAAQGTVSQVRQQESALEQAELSFELAETAYKRTQELYAEGAVTRVELELSQNEMETAAESVEQARAALNAAKKLGEGNTLQYQGQKESIQAQLNRLREQKAKALVAAAADGTVFATGIEKGGFVSPGMLMFTIGRTGKIQIETYVNTKDIRNLETGDSVKVLFKMPGKDTELAGTITRVNPAAEERVSSLGIIEDKIKVIAELDEKPAGLRITPGMSVDVTFTTQEVRGVLAVPREAVFNDNGKDYVWVIKGGKAVLGEITTGAEGDELIEVKTGLQEGEQVILNPHQEGLAEGMKVK
ncbi:efflux RND transporter periplasmic adaptor subunit [Phosphitispora sp. TUW77]|uniref:efflux RND transporter periplasmic adaptor subunit n=1 Tax=Phosphitispora sp. TUW77 TaxID=3152361 RepID=UPI003AB64EA1